MLRFSLLGLCCTASLLLWIPSGDPAQPPTPPLKAVTQGLQEASLADFARLLNRL